VAGQLLAAIVRLKAVEMEVEAEVEAQEGNKEVVLASSNFAIVLFSFARVARFLLAASLVCKM